MQDKFRVIYETIISNMTKLDEKKISVEQAKAMASLAKQANNIIATQLDAAKFLSKEKNGIQYIQQVGL